MKKFLTRWKRSAAALGLGMTCLMSAQASHAAILGPYSPDANTTYLYHLDEAANSSSAANSGTAGTPAVSYNGEIFAGAGNDQTTISSVLGASAYAGFGNAANISSQFVGLGVDASGNGAFRLDEFAAVPTSNDRLPSHATIFGAGNAFTLEAMVNMPSITGTNREIIASDNGDSTNAERGFQFRINSPGQLEFNYIGVPTIAALTTAIPTTGDHAFVANEWFHAAFVFDGTNGQFFWTRVANSFTAANPISGLLADTVDVTDAAIIVIGNEARATNTTSGTGSGEGLRGLIDEVRISNVARTADQFIFGVPEPSTAVMAVAGLLLAGVRRRRDG
jgi:hypothetical protein